MTSKKTANSRDALMQFLKAPWTIYDNFNTQQATSPATASNPSSRYQAYLRGSKVLLSIFVIAPVEPHLLWVHDP
jgi:hypothetical protein